MTEHEKESSYLDNTASDHGNIVEVNNVKQV